eukprot:jgi/Galph1/1274/GphlegSOOS_G6041.1
MYFAFSSFSLCGSCTAYLRTSLKLWLRKKHSSHIFVAKGIFGSENRLQRRGLFLKQNNILRLKRNRDKVCYKFNRTFCAVKTENQLSEHWWRVLCSIEKLEEGNVENIDVTLFTKQAYDAILGSSRIPLSLEMEQKRLELKDLLEDVENNGVQEQLYHQLDTFGKYVLFLLESPHEPIVAELSHLSDSNHNHKQDNWKQNMKGIYPNVRWNSIDKAVLRSHPLYRPLPPPNLVSITSSRDFRMLRQDSEEWEMVRRFSQVSASSAWRLLGFGESNAATILGIPTGMRGHHHAMLAWKSLLDHSFEELFDNVSKTRMEWGQHHETNCLLTFLEYIRSMKDIRMQEVGLFVLQKEQILPQWSIEYEELPTISASPDALFRTRQSNGVWSGWEICEAKCRCPFVPKSLVVSRDSLKDITQENNSWGETKEMKQVQWSFVNLRPLQKLSPYYYAQLQLQMLCSDIAEKGYLIAFSVTNGCNIFQVVRNDAWLEHCLYFIREFYQRYGNLQHPSPPPVNYFWNMPRYQEFIQLTREQSDYYGVWKHLSPQECIFLSKHYHNEQADHRLFLE